MFLDPQPVTLNFGQRLPGLEIAYETWGRLSSQKDNAILICPAFSAHSHARSHPGNRNPGWWEEMIGPGKAFDTDQYFLICASLLGSCYGTTGPLSMNPESGQPYQGDFPTITIRDIADTQMRLLDHLEIESLFAVAGGSMGGMEVLELAIRIPKRIGKLISISATDRTRPYSATIRHVGRRCIMLDPNFCGGYYGTQPPLAGLKLAREIGTIFYRSREEFNSRFSCRPLNSEDPPQVHEITFDFQSYLSHQGNKILPTFDANSYLRLSFAMDLFDLSRDFEDMNAALSRIEAECLIVGISEDRLIPVDEQRGLHLALLKAGCRSQWRRMSSPVGHDAFLKEFEDFTPLIRGFLG